jgi:uncharacterized membrane protein
MRALLMSAVSQQVPLTTRALSTREQAPLWRLRLQWRETVARSLVLVPGLYLLAAVALGIAMPAIDRAGAGGHVLGIDEGAAQSILEAVATGMIAFSGLVVSIAVLVVQFGAGQYSPRLVQTFRRDPIIKNAIGLFVVPGVYALVAVADIGGSPHDRPETLTVGVALLLMVLAIATLFRFIGRLLDLMRPRRIYARLLHDIRPAVEDVYPFLLSEHVERQPAPQLPVVATLLHEHRDGLLAAVDRAGLVRAASDAGAVIEVTAQIGSFVGYGSPILIVHGGTPIDAHVLRRALLFADGRTVTQDPAFGIRCMVDVAIRALSAAINDPTSAVEGLDALDALLHRLGHRRLEAAAVLGSDGAIRLVLPTPGWEELLDLALTEIRIYGAEMPQVARRLAALLDGLEAGVPEQRRASVRRHRELLAADVQRLYGSSAARAFADTPDRLGIGGSSDSER